MEQYTCCAALRVGEKEGQNAPAGSGIYLQQLREKEISKARLGSFDLVTLKTI